MTKQKGNHMNKDRQSYGDTSVCECPHCRENIFDIWKMDLDLQEIVCPHCGEELGVECSQDITLTWSERCNV